MADLAPLLRTVTSSVFSTHVSVIIRTRDRHSLLSEALRSLTMQTLKPYEVIVVNDGGKPVADLVQTYSEVFHVCRVIDLHPRRGRSAAANIGLDAASGDYLIFLDDDDWFDPQHLDLLANAVRNTGSEVVYTGARCLRRAEGNAWIEVYHFDESFDALRLHLENYLPIHTVLFSRRLVESGCRFDESFDTYEDWDFWLQLLEQTGKFEHIPGMSAVYRIGDDSGFGVEGDRERCQQARARLLTKWAPRWSGEVLGTLFDRAKDERRYRTLLDGLQAQLFNSKTQTEISFETLVNPQETGGMAAAGLQAKVFDVEPKPENLPVVLNGIIARMASYVRELKNARAALVAKEAALVAKEHELMTVTHERDQARIDYAGAQTTTEQLITRIRELEASTSWRITAPLRKLVLGGRALVAHRRQWQYYGCVGAQILRQEGSLRLFQRIRHKLRSPYRYSVSTPTHYSISETWMPLEFPKHESPQVSIVIPVHNKHLYTFTCLKSLYETTISTPCEIIIVDDQSNDETPRMLKTMNGVRVVRNQGERGFVHACNLGASVARGQYLIFLNNDTIVLSGWLEALLDTFKRYPDAGLVGACLIYPDGRLQEAGGIVWQDGSAWNYGRFDDFEKPQYNYVREVDYCSGACIGLPRSLFEHLGSFDLDFAPAYYEDTDLAMRVHQAGYRVLYQPATRVIHFEGISSGTDTAGMGVKRFQIVHRAKFAERWRSTLSKHRPNSIDPDLEKDRGISRRILVIDEYMLVPDRDSGSLRMFRCLELMQSLGYKVTFVAVNLEYRAPYGRELQQRGVEVLYSPFVVNIEHHLLNCGRHYHSVLISRADNAERYIPLVRRYAPQARVIFDTVDLHFLREQRLAELKGSATLAAAAARRKAQELGLMRSADVTLVVSIAERELLKAELPEAHIEVVSNIHDVKGCRIGFAERVGIVFVGSFNHPPNNDAIQFYARDILPRLRVALPGVTTYIIGADPPMALTNLAAADFVFTGYVPNLDDYFNHCRLSVAPLRYGAGVKGKINTSMAYGVPVVATPVAIEGMNLCPGEDVLVAESAEDFAAAIVRLYNDAVLWELLSHGGCLNIERYFSPQVVRAALAKALDPVGW